MMPGVLDTFRTFRRRLAVPRVLSPVLPARHPRRCRECGGLVIPDRSRRYGGFARPNLVDAMGFQTKKGTGINIKKGVGVIVADSTKPCCCTGTNCCACGFCTGLDNPCCITAVVSGITACSCTSINKTLASAVLPNGTYQLVCNTIHPPTPSPCLWGKQYVSTDPEAVTINTYTDDTCASLVSSDSLGWTIIVRNDGSGSVRANITYNGGGVNAFFEATTTTTTANACNFATPITFTNENACGDAKVSLADGGTVVVTGGC